MKKLQHIFLTLTLLAFSGTGYAATWSFSGTSYMYFHNKGGWTDSGKMLFIGKDSYSSVYTMSAVSNTQLWVVQMPSSGWSDASYMAVAGGGSIWGSGSWGPSNRTNATHYTNTYTSGISTSSTQYYVLVPSSTSNNASISLTYFGNAIGSLNKTITVKAKVSTNGGSTYSEATSPGTLSASSKTFTAYNSCANSTSLSSGTISCGYTATTTLTAADATNYDFVGWYNSSGTQQTTSKTLTIYPTANATYYAYYKLKQFTVSYGVCSTTRYGSITLNSGSAVTTTSSSTLNHGTAISFTASPNSGYQVEGWYSDASCTAGNKLQSGGTSYDAGTLTAAKTVYVKFEAKTGGILTLNAGTGGQVSTDNSSWGTTKYITDITNTTARNIYAKANTGYTFSSWSRTSGSGTIASTSSASTTFTPVAYEDATVAASFSEKKSTLTTSNHYDVGNPGYAVPTKTVSSIGIATTSTLTATAPGTGYAFAGWTLSSNLVVTSGNSATDRTITVRTTGNGAAATAQANYTEVLTSTYYVEGDASGPFSQGWTANATTMMKKRTGSSADPDVYWTLEVPANKTAPGENQWEFKIYNSAGANDNAKYMGWGTGDNHYWVTKANNSLNLSTTGSNNMYFKCYVEGTYTFHLNYSTPSSPTLTITWPVVNQLRISAASPTDATNTNNFDLTDQGSNNWSVTRTLNANTTYTFKMVYDGEWYGKNSTALTRASSTANSLSSDGADMTLRTDVAGSYTFTFNSSTKNLTVTYPTAYTVTYNGNSQTEGSIPDVSGSYYASGSNVTLATNTGILYKTGNAFNGWNTLSGGGGTHYASGGTLTGISDNVTLYAEWKANDNHMYFYNKDNWSSVSAHMWKHIAPSVNDPERTYPGRTMTLHQGKVYKIDYRSDVQDSVVFNNGNTGSGNQTGDIKIADGQSGDHWFYNDADKSVNTGGIHHGWSQYIMVAEFPSSTVAAVVGERITISPVLAWAEDVTFNEIEITSTRASGNATVNAIISGTNIIVSGTTANTSATFNIKYTYSTTTITKTLTVNIKNGIVIQSKVPQDDNHWVYSNVMKLHYWGTGISDGDVTMAWVKADDSYTYFQTFVPLGTDNKINFLFFYDYMNGSEMWRQTTNITNVTTAGCYEIKHNNGLDAQRTWARSGDNCVDTWQVEITMGSGDIFTSNVVDNSTDIISFFAPSNANESHTYRQGVVTLEHNGATVATIPAATFTQSGVYTAKVNTSTPGLTNVALYTGNYYIRTDASHGGWDNYKTDPLNKMTNFNRNANFPNETFSYYWVDNVAKTPGDPVNIKATVANDYNPVLTNFSIDESVAREVDGLNLRFGYEPTTNDLIRGILRGSTTDNFLNVIGTTGNIYRDAACATPMNETTYSEHPDYLKMQDKSNWVYEILAYTIIDGDHGGANVYLKSYFNGIHYLLGMEKDEDGRDTSTPNNLPVIVPGTTHDTYGLRVIYDFKTNRLFAAWAPADRTISSDMNVDADIMFLRHEQDSVAQITFANTTPAPQITGLNKAIFAVEIADDRNTSLGNRELHYFFTLPFDCNVKDIFGIGGFMEYWGIQYYDGAERARIGWFVETPTFWKWLDWNDRLNAGQGYLLSIDKKALQNNDQWKEVNFMDLEGGVWVDKGKKSILTLYFPSAGSGFSMSAATGSAQTITYENQPCSITRDDRDQKDSNWKCIGTPGYKNMKMTGYTATSPAPPVWDGHTPPNFLYEFNEQTTTATYAKGTYTVRNGRTWNYRAFHSYMVQYAGTINWGAFSAGNGPSAIVARRAPQNEMSQATNVEIDLLSEDSTALDRTFVWLREDATAGYDQNYDLNKMVESYANQIYSLSDHDIPFAANVMPYETDTVRLVVNIVNPGEFTFSMLKDEHFGLTPILYDMYKSERIDLTSADYTVELDYGKYTDRFFLLFSPVKPVATAIETTEDGTQNVLSGEAIYDVLGRRVSTVTPGHLYIVNGEKRIAQ